ncbi:MAG: TlpA family protein disulfide reductase [Pseudomonadales bacterium]|nr:TlpA family protein disulfide reductase [Pseudomonadales bacterium]MBO6567092.1 TlpA family protein disulfide reductase [Pseudomonadales bacterium]MBO6595796.1 TlpA family protein disulfide reductase [Pseudomonadales bacterium]MBO6657416.1 TlpA family protein disulfide reductase [Pseudomonadales bacterium]MBO6702401.1 TlpA family protein disulfide reductase [Pseudomonadales bacterium]
MKHLICCLFLLPVFAWAETESTGSAPTFRLNTLDGESVNSESLRGKVIYLDFWASWCGPCKVSFPDMKALQSEFGRDVFQVIAVSVDSNPKDARRFVERFEPNFLILTDPEGAIAERFSIPAMPTSFLIDQHGNIRHMHKGYRPGDAEKLKPLIAALTGEDPA